MSKDYYKNRFQGTGRSTHAALKSGFLLGTFLLLHRP